MLVVENRSRDCSTLTSFWPSHKARGTGHLASPAAPESTAVVYLATHGNPVSGHPLPNLLSRILDPQPWLRSRFFRQCV